MIFIYIDECGAGLKDERSPYFVLAALSMPASEWQQLDSQISVQKRQIISYAKPEDWEIKGREMRRGEKLFRIPQKAKHPAIDRMSYKKIWQAFDISAERCVPVQSGAPHQFKLS
ncbi:MAG: DUF3800 domain-containing protein [Chloroflexi bacterium]|nr:DUF3800 domain-containing protein [Chloroflexota bacterium]